MVICMLDGRKMTSRAAAHDELKQALALPEYYGRNLDALWDCISIMEAQVRLTGKNAMLDNLGSYGESLYRTLCEAAVRNPNFEFSCAD